MEDLLGRGGSLLIPLCVSIRQTWIKGHKVGMESGNAGRVTLHGIDVLKMSTKCTADKSPLKLFYIWIILCQSWTTNILLLPTGSHMVWSSLSWYPDAQLHKRCCLAGSSLQKCSQPPLSTEQLLYLTSVGKTNSRRDVELGSQSHRKVRWQNDIVLQVGNSCQWIWDDSCGLQWHSGP